MYKIFDEVMELVKETTKTWEWNCWQEEKTLSEEKILGDALSPLLFLMEMIGLNHLQRAYTGGYKQTKYPQKIKHQIYMDDIKLFAT